MFKLSFLLLFIISCSHIKEVAKNKVIVIKQWHLSPQTITTDYKTSSGLPQYLNQRDIYLYLYKLVNNHPEELTIIAEGCEKGTIIDENFLPSYNGWNAKNLKPHKDQLHYSEILTFLPLKVKVQFPSQVTSVCGDSESLAKNNQLALSEAKGFLSFHLKLKENLDDQKKYQTYAKALEETQNRKIADPIVFSKQQALKNFQEFNRIIKQRNGFLADMARKNLNKNPVIIVGGLHAKDLEAQLKDSGIEVEIYTPHGYPLRSENLADEFIEILKD